MENAIEKLKHALKTGIEVLVSFVIVVAAFAWIGTIYQYTLISLPFIFLLSFFVCIPLLFWFYTKKPNSLFNGLKMSPYVFGLSLFMGGVIFLSINYIQVGERTKKEYQIIERDSIISRGNRKNYVKIKWNNKLISLRVFIAKDEKLKDKKKLILETRRGLLGFEIIKERVLE